MRNLAASIQQRLLNYSNAQKVEANLIFARFAAERWLYRLAQSPYAERFVLKGAMLLLVWFAEIVCGPRAMWTCSALGNCPTTNCGAPLRRFARSRSNRTGYSPGTHRKICFPSNTMALTLPTMSVDIR